MLRYVLLSVLILFLNACAPTARFIADEDFKGPSRAYEAKLPVGWVRAATPSDTLLITRDGVFLQQMGIARLDLDKAFPLTRRAAKEGMLPLELAELQVAEIKASAPERRALEIMELKPARIGDARAYRLRARYYNGWGLEILRDTYGFTHLGEYYVVHYEAPALFYYERHRADFEKFLASLRLREKCTFFCGS